MINNKKNLEDYVEIFSNIYEFIAVIDIDNNTYEILSSSLFGVPIKGNLVEALEFSDKLIHKEDVNVFNNNINPKYLRKYF